MIALDTNVLVRFLVEDDVRQSLRAKRLVQSQVDVDAQCFVPDIVLCELVWVLQASYKVSRLRIAEVLSELSRARHILLESAERVSRAVKAYAAGKGDFADYLIREVSLGHGCEAVATFDADVVAEPGFGSVP